MLWNADDSDGIVERKEEGEQSFDLDCSTCIGWLFYIDFPALFHTDCHSSAAQRLSAECSNVVNSDHSTGMSETERSDGTLIRTHGSELAKGVVSISLTLCSMASALQPIPSECSSWTHLSVGKEVKEERRWGWKKNVDQDLNVQRSMCLKWALEKDFGAVTKKLIDS